MNKKTAFQIILLVVLTGFAIYLITGYFKPAKIQIFCEVHPPRMFHFRNNNHNRAPQPRQYMVAFGMDEKYELKEIKVVRLDDWTTNKNTPPLWHVISDSNSAPIKAVIYGQWIRGMHPAIKGARPEELETNVAYRLFIDARSTDGQCDFKLNALPETAAR